ncbi:MAG TPA: metallophosphoesterase [Candidatus Polarisedimenticolaceae bacterium]|nr:metallophosphoesterase [Candidatus Polarisedimenticolaceae bacterium]
MRRIVVIGDVHGEQQRLARVLSWIADEPPALALLVGDLAVDPPWRAPLRLRERGAHDRSVREVLARVRAALGCPVLFVPGNHDLPDPDPAAVGTNCDGSVVDCAGLRVGGLGGAGPARFGFPYEWGERDASAALAALSAAGERIDLLVCHAPPHGSTLDRIHRGEHVGSRAVREWVVAARPRLAVFGHIHEAWGLERLDGVPCLNAGALGEPFGEEIIWSVDWDERAGPLVVRSYHPAAGEFETRDWLGPDGR